MTNSAADTASKFVATNGCGCAQTTFFVVCVAASFSTQSAALVTAVACARCFALRMTM
ncbi:MAG: hypothetical protein NTV22_03510 [bacterium]|nr:hypothetical protein [bacterium]